MRFALLLVAALAFPGVALAQHAHGEKGPNGGEMQDVAGVEAELLTSGNTVTINVFDEGKKAVSTKGFTGSALIVNGTDRETLTLVPVGDNSLKGDAKKPVTAGATITIVVKTSAGKSGQAKFKL